MLFSLFVVLIVLIAYHCPLLLHDHHVPVLFLQGYPKFQTLMFYVSHPATLLWPASLECCILTAFHALAAVLVNSPTLVLWPYLDNIWKQNTLVDV